MWILENYDQKDSLILSVGEKDEVSIKIIAKEIAKNFDYEDRLIFDPSYADGQFKKIADNTKLMNLIASFEFTTIYDGIKKCVQWFINNYEIARK